MSDVFIFICHTFSHLNVFFQALYFHVHIAGLQQINNMTELAKEKNTADMYNIYLYNKVCNIGIIR